MSPLLKKQIIESLIFGVVLVLLTNGFCYIAQLEIVYDSWLSMLLGVSFSSGMWFLLTRKDWLGIGKKEKRKESDAKRGV